MSNPYGITLDREWSEWAAKFGASPTVAAALFLISERHPSLEVIAKLTLREVEQVAAIVQRWPDCFPPGSLDALKCRSQTLAQPPSVRVSADPTSRRRPARVSAESLHRRAYTRRFEHAQGAGMHIIAFTYVDMKSESDTVSDFTNLAPSVLYGLAAGHYNEQEEAAILAATREGRVDQDRAGAICEALAPPEDAEDADDQQDDDADDGDDSAEEDTESAAILDGPRPVPPSAPIAPPPDFALRAFDEAVTALKKLMTKSAAQFASTVHSAGDLEAIESFIRAVADRARRGAS
jgi:hypothetical protein